MNEAQVLMYLLSRKKDHSTIGATKEEICTKLGLTDRNADYKVWNIIQGLNQSLFPLGLTAKINPLNSHWFIGFQDKMEINFGGNIHTLSPRLAATLFTILILYVGKSENLTAGNVQKLRNKKDISTDLRELEKLGFIEVADDDITLTPKIFYYVDVNELIEKIKELKESGEE